MEFLEIRSFRSRGWGFAGHEFWGFVGQEGGALPVTNSEVLSAKIVGALPVTNSGVLSAKKSGTLSVSGPGLCWP